MLSDLNVLEQINLSPYFDSEKGWSEGFAKAIGNGPGVIVGPGTDNPNVFAQQFKAVPGMQYRAVTCASSVNSPKAKGRFQINWLDAEGQFISSFIKSFDVTTIDMHLECIMTAPPDSAMGVLYVTPEGKEHAVRYLEMSIFAYHGMAGSSAYAVDDIPRFPTNIIHLSDPTTFSQYGNLFRGYDDEVIFKEMILAVRENTMVSYDGLVGLLSMVRYCEQAKIRGDYVEIGSWRGGCVGLMAQGVLRYGAALRNIHVFDSFQGLPQPIAGKDFDGFVEPMFNVTEETAQGKLEPIDFLVASEDDVTKLLFDKLKFPQSHVHIHKGWFQETLPAVESNIKEIAILRLDGDFYDSYKVALEYLYPKVIAGGFIIIDDWVLGGCRQALLEYFEKIGINPFMWSLDCTTRCFQKT